MRAKERHAREMAEYEAKFAARDAKTAATGKKPGAMAGGGFEQSTIRKAAVAAGSLLVVAIDVVLAPNDKQQLAPMLGKIGALPEELGDPETLLADTGYFSAANSRLARRQGSNHRSPWAVSRIIRP